MFKKIRNILNYKLRRLLKPGMIYGIKHNGTFLKDTRISNTSVIEHPEYLTLHDNVFIGHYNFIEASNKIEIKEGCQITNYISIISHSSHSSIRLYGPEYRKYNEHKGYMKGSVSIGAYTFIGPHSLIMPGSKLGKGCLVQAYSHVKGEFPDFSIIGGNPAQTIGDTRKMDESLLEEYPELKPNYIKWAGEKE